MKNKDIKKDMCLKSFDGIIEGKIKGWIFAKVVFGSGGHQDNVFEEANNLCEWICKYKKNNNELFVLLIDTNLIDKFNLLKNKFNTIKNIIIVNTNEFQKYIIENYYNDNI